MKEVFIILAGMSVCGGAAYLMYLLTISAFGRRLSSAGRFEFLKVAALLFVLPVSKLLSPLLSVTERFTAPAPAAPSAPSAPSAPVITPSQAIVSGSAPAAPSAPQMSVFAPAAPRIDIDIIAVLAVIWLIGIAVILIWRIICRLRFERDINGMLIPAGGEIMSVYSHCREDMGITRNIPVYICEKVYTPMIVGALRPKIILPQKEISERSLEFVFRHELTHYQRGDIFVKAFISLITALHWFNPLVHAFRRELILRLELSCDERAGQMLDLEGRKEYCMAILEAVPIKRKADIGLVFGTSGKEELKKRLENMMNFKKMQLSQKIIAAIVAAVILVSSCVLVACATPVDREKNDDLPAGDISTDDGVKNDTDGSDSADDNKDDGQDTPDNSGPDEIDNDDTKQDIIDHIQWVLDPQGGYTEPKYDDTSIGYAFWIYQVDEHILLLVMNSDVDMEGRVEYLLNEWKRTGEYDIREIITLTDSESRIAEIRLVLGNKEDGEKILERFAEMGYAPKIYIIRQLYEIAQTVYDWQNTKEYEIIRFGIRPNEGYVYIIVEDEAEREAIRQALVSMGYHENFFRLESEYEALNQEINSLPR